MKIGLLDHMGFGNLGDAATQDALIANIRARLPDADIVGFSLNPEDTRMRHHIVCYPITNWCPTLEDSSQLGIVEENPWSPIKSFLKKIPILSPTASWIRNLLREVLHLGRSFTAVRSLDSLILSGGGQLCELWRGPWSHPYNVFKFSLLTKLANRKLLLINVGAGPLKSILSKVFVGFSVRLADYVSFRDIESQVLVRGLGVKRQTHVFSDSVYSLDLSDIPARDAPKATRPLVGINPMGFCDPRVWPTKDSSAYSRYLDKVEAFCLWLLKENYRVRFFSSDMSVDLYALEDLKGRLERSLSPVEVAEVCVPPGTTVTAVLRQIAEFDFVVTAKFHGVVFSHLLAKPVIALSYHHKIDDLMRAAGHSQYCLGIAGFDQQGLRRTFTALVENASGLKQIFRRTTADYSGALKIQFDELFTHPKLQSTIPQVTARNKDTVLDGSF